jgi:hypothetical protein
MTARRAEQHRVTRTRTNCRPSPDTPSASTPATRRAWRHDRRHYTQKATWLAIGHEASSETRPHHDRGWIAMIHTNLADRREKGRESHVFRGSLKGAVTVARTVPDVAASTPRSSFSRAPIGSGCVRRSHWSMLQIPSGSTSRRGTGLSAVPCLRFFAARSVRNRLSGASGSHAVIRRGRRS